MLTFTEDCFTGIDEIDAKRKKIYKIILTEFEDKSQKQGEERLRHLVEQISEISSDWFSEEETYLLNISSPERELQIGEHNEFLETLRKRIEEAEKTVDEKSCDALYSSIMKFLIQWFFRHIVCKDTLITGDKETVKDTEKPSDNLNGGEERSAGTSPKKGKLAFTDEYKIGVPHIDDEHKMLFSIIGEAFQLMNDEFLYDKYDQIRHILGELIEYTKTHFKDEEEYMESIGYEGLADQKRAHKRFVDKLEGLELENLEENQDEYLSDLLDFLLNWLVNHILKVDKLIPAK